MIATLFVFAFVIILVSGMEIADEYLVQREKNKHKRK